MDELPKAMKMCRQEFDLIIEDYYQNIYVI